MVTVLAFSGILSNKQKFNPGLALDEQYDLIDRFTLYLNYTNNSSTPQIFITGTESRFGTVMDLLSLEMLKRLIL